MNYIFLFLFSFIYVLKQTVEFSEYSAFFGFVSAGIMVFISIINLQTVNKRKPLTFIALNLLLIVFINSIYRDFYFIIFLIIKIFFYFSFAVIFNNGRKSIIFMNNCFLFFTIIVLALSSMNIMENKFSSQENWTKSFAGFVNPNIGPFFLFQCFCIYFLQRCKVMTVVTLLITIVMYYFNIYSRTFMFGSFLLFVFFVYINYCNIFVKKYLLLVVLFFSMSLLSSFVFHDPFSLVGGEVDVILSYRITALYDSMFVPGDSLLGYNISPIDSIYYEIIFIFGPVFTYFFINGVLNVSGLYFNSTNKNFSKRALSVVMVVVLIGGFEGIFMKVSPLSIFLFSVLYLGSQRLSRHGGFGGDSKNYIIANKGR